MCLLPPEPPQSPMPMTPMLSFGGLLRGPKSPRDKVDSTETRCHPVGRGARGSDDDNSRRARAGDGEMMAVCGFVGPHESQLLRSYGVLGGRRIRRSVYVCCVYCVVVFVASSILGGDSGVLCCYDCFVFCGRACGMWGNKFNNQSRGASV